MGIANTVARLDMKQSLHSRDVYCEAIELLGIWFEGSTPKMSLMTALQYWPAGFCKHVVWYLS